MYQLEGNSRERARKESLGSIFNIPGGHTMKDILKALLFGVAVGSISFGLLLGAAFADGTQDGSYKGNLGPNNPPQPIVILR